MQKILVAVVIGVALLTAQPRAQTANPPPAAPSAAPVTLDAVAKALGASKGLTQIQFSARGSNNAYGQAWRPDQPWPAFKIFSYTATVDYATPVRGGGGLPLLTPQTQSQAISGKVAWNLATPVTGGAPVANPAPGAVADRQLLLWTLTPQ